MTIIDVNVPRMLQLSQEVVDKAKQLSKRVDAFTYDLQNLDWTDQKSLPQFNRRKEQWTDASRDTSRKLNRLGNRVTEIAQRYGKLEDDLMEFWASRS
ncbi:hypothetical protein [Phytohabitans suffuscus]|uniref:Uncharacterized protein n=1 Tax=Phytohabitans suffuscus TaxID=624315 RepID=A0A6F8YQI7_9ACTN|nr:hypothetical protein [Phytohabitans suffuscus]BCB88316.1 hypothetical protein Psuf_056290 [Phytohabitans suffuscus]